MSIETVHPEIPAQRTKEFPSSRHDKRALDASAWIVGYLQDARLNGRLDDAKELQFMMEVANQPVRK
jgi:hypothetical protein